MTGFGFLAFDLGVRAQGTWEGTFTVHLGEKVRDRVEVLRELVPVRGLEDASEGPADAEEEHLLRENLMG